MAIILLVLAIFLVGIKLLSSKSNKPDSVSINSKSSISFAEECNNLNPDSINKIFKSKSVEIIKDSVSKLETSSSKVLSCPLRIKFEKKTNTIVLKIQNFKNETPDTQKKRIAELNQSAKEKNSIYSNQIINNVGDATVFSTRKLARITELKIVTISKDKTINTSLSFDSSQKENKDITKDTLVQLNKQLLL